MTYSKNSTLFEPFDMIQRIGLFSHDAKNWTLFEKYDS